MSSSPIPAPPQDASATARGLVNTGAQTFAGVKTFTSAPVIPNLSGTNSGDLSLAAVGSSPNANGASLSGQVLTLQPADGSNPGVVTAGTQTIGGAKTFSGLVSGSANCSFKSASSTGQISTDDSVGSFFKYSLSNITNNGNTITLTANGSTFSLNTSGVVAASASGGVIFGGSTPNAAAILQTDSTSRGFLPPRMTTTQRNAISSPPAGLVIFNTTTTKLETFDGAIWQAAW